MRLVDEYDAIGRDLEPFWKMSVKEFRERTKQVGRPRDLSFLTLSVWD